MMCQEKNVTAADHDGTISKKFFD